MRRSPATVAVTSRARSLSFDVRSVWRKSLSARWRAVCSGLMLTHSPLRNRLNSERDSATRLELDGATRVLALAVVDAALSVTVARAADVGLVLVGVEDELQRDRLAHRVVQIRPSRIERHEQAISTLGSHGASTRADRSTRVVEDPPAGGGNSTTSEASRRADCRNRRTDPDERHGRASANRRDGMAADVPGRGRPVWLGGFDCAPQRATFAGSQPAVWSLAGR